MIKKRFISMLVLLCLTVTSAWAETTVTFTASDLADGSSITKDGVTLTSYGQYGINMNGVNGPGEFTNSLGGNFTQIVVTADGLPSGDGWSAGTWTGSASSVSFTGNIDTWGNEFTIVCTLETTPASTYTVTLKEGTDDADNWTITPAEATTTGVAAGTEVKATYSGTKKVKSVKAVKKAAPAPALNLTSPAVGQVIGDDGKNYAYGSLPTGVTKVAMIAYVSGTNGLAIALADEGSLNWETAKSTCEAKTPAFTGGTWKLPTQAEWKQMFSANGGSETSYSGLNTAIGNAGGTALQEYVAYWSSTENGSDNAYGMFLEDGNAYFGSDSKDVGNRVRACLAFTVEAPAGVTAYTLAESTLGMVVGTDGKAYDVADKDNLPDGVTAAGVVVYKNGANGLAIALTDEASMMDWATACGESGAAAHTPTVEDQTWKLPSQEEWTLVKNANSGSSLNSAITNAGGTAIPTVHFDPETGTLTGQYWLSTENSYNTDIARVWGINAYDEIVVGDANQGLKTDNILVRACLAW